MIGELGFPGYFLLVHDIVRFARAQEPPILCQGRGSAANSAVCYCLEITAVDPAEVRRRIALACMTPEVDGGELDSAARDVVARLGELMALLDERGYGDA